MSFDPATETARYIDRLGAEALQKAADYTTACHWMLLWELLTSAMVTWILVRIGVLEKVLEKIQTSGWALRTWLVCVTYFLVYAITTLPWRIYEEWGFEKSYGRTSQPLSDFLMQDAIGSILASLFGALFLLGIYALIRRAGNQWWLWSGGLAVLAVFAIMLLSPIAIEPLFNEYTPVPEGPVREALLKMADEADIPHDRLFMYDGSRQSNNFTANVSGVLGSARIAISDVALKQASLDEVKAVTAHEVGHYVLGHVWRTILVLSVLVIAVCYFADRLYPRFARLFGSKSPISEPAGLPVLMFLVSLIGLVLTEPISNAMTRQIEREADDYSLQMVNLPDALAGALIKTAEYRYPRPTALQEALFYTHPSVERRVRNAMEWKARQIKKAIQ